MWCPPDVCVPQKLKITHSASLSLNTLIGVHAASKFMIHSSLRGFPYSVGFPEILHCCLVVNSSASFFFASRNRENDFSILSGFYLPMYIV